MAETDSVTMTIQLPTTFYERLATRARHNGRSVAAEAVHIIIETVEVEERLPTTVESLLAQLDYLDDVELLRAARRRAELDDEARMAQLVGTQQRGKLTKLEQAEAVSLAARFNQVMLVRAKAATLLNARGYDVDRLIYEGG